MSEKVVTLKLVNLLKDSDQLHVLIYFKNLGFLDLVRMLLKETDLPLLKHLEGHDMGNLFFCHRYACVGCVACVFC